jgi:hypothetical protein
MTTLYFFGDSWPQEGPVENSTITSYPTLVGQYLNLPIKNYSVGGSSQPDMIQQLLNCDIKAGDLAIFSLTAGSRKFYYDPKGKPVNSSSVPAMKHLDLSNDFNDTWIAAQTCYILHHYCQDRSITPWFINTFNIAYHKNYHHKLWESIPDSCWILPKDRCVIEHFDPEFFGQWEEFHNSDFNSWLDTNNQQVQYYIRPYYNHPHINGRTKIAEIIAEKIIICGG